jgi:conserved oligomeric Golgi complex subunit 6
VHELTTNVPSLHLSSMAPTPLPTLKQPPTLELRRGSSSPQTPLTPVSLKGLNPLTTKVTSVLSTSYADSEFREALAILDERGVQNNPETRRHLRLRLQKDVIDSNGEIVGDFKKVADVGFSIPKCLEKKGCSLSYRKVATPAHKLQSIKPQ